MYYIGYGQNFTNYKKGTAETNQSPETPRLRIGLVHAAEIDDDALDNVDFDSYLIQGPVKHSSACTWLTEQGSGTMPEFQVAFTVSRIPTDAAACTTYAGYGPLFRVWVSSAVLVEVANMVCGALWSRRRNGPASPVMASCAWLP